MPDACSEAAWAAVGGSPSPSCTLPEYCYGEKGVSVALWLLASSMCWQGKERVIHLHLLADHEILISAWQLGFAYWGYCLRSPAPVLPSETISQGEPGHLQHVPKSFSGWRRPCITLRAVPAAQSRFLVEPMWEYTLWLLDVALVLPDLAGPWVSCGGGKKSCPAQREHQDPTACKFSCGWTTVGWVHVVTITPTWCGAVGHHIHHPYPPSCSCPTVLASPPARGGKNLL